MTKMSNSPLVSYTKISPNKGNWDSKVRRYIPTRTHKIDTITIHCVVGQASVERLGEIFANPNRNASANYGVGFDGRIGMYVEEKDRSWCSSNGANDNRAITIEVASDSYHPYAVNAKAWKGMIDLLVDICKRNDIKELKWKANKNLIGKPELQNMTVHRWFDNKACPGDYLYKRHSEIAAEVNKLLKEDPTPSPDPKPEPTPEPKPGKLDVDGIFGPMSVSAMQKWLGSIVDGVISDQVMSMRKYYRSVTAVEFGTGGSLCIRKLQSKVGSSQDGYLGPDTVKALQRFLNKQGFKIDVDGYWGEETSKAFQNYLNNVL